MPRNDMRQTVIVKRLRPRSTTVAEQGAPPTTPEPVFWTEQQCCEALGISDWTLSQWRADGLPCMKRGRIVRFVPSDVVAWVRAQYDANTPIPLKRAS